MKKQKLTTIALEDNQHLVITRRLVAEAYCEGYTDNKRRNRRLDGYYLVQDLRIKSKEN